MIQLIIHNHVNQERLNFTDLVESISLSTEINKPSKLKFTYLKQGFQAPNGSLVIFSYKDKVMFKGYIFNSINTEKHIEVLCYDQLRYFQNKDSFITKNQTLSNVLKFIISKNQLEEGVIEDTQVILDSKIYQNKAYLDVLEEMLDFTLIQSDKQFILRDENGKICLRDITKLKTGVIIGTGHLASSYTYEKSIDENTFNAVKLTKKNGETLESFLVVDSFNINKWGLLQYYEEVENLSDTLIKQKAEELLNYYNKETKKLSFNDCILNENCIAGNIIQVYLENLGINQNCIIKSATMDFKNTMRMNLEVYYD